MYLGSVLLAGSFFLRCGSALFLVPKSPRRSEEHVCGAKNTHA